MHIYINYFENSYYLKMVANRYTSKETREFNKCFNEILNYIDKLKIEDLNKNNKKKINKIYEQSNNCKNLINEKNKELKNKENKLNCYNIFTIDFYNIENNKPHLNILPNNIKNQIILKKGDKDNILIRCSKIWKIEVNENIKNEYKKLTENRVFTKKDYEKLLNN